MKCNDKGHPKESGSKGIFEVPRLPGLKRIFAMECKDIELSQVFKKFGPHENNWTSMMAYIFSQKEIFIIFIFIAFFFTFMEQFFWATLYHAT